VNSRSDKGLTRPGAISRQKPSGSITLRKNEAKHLAPVRSVLTLELAAKLEGWIVLQGRKAYAANSLRALLSDWAHFARWARESGQVAYLSLAGPGDLMRYFDDHNHLAKATLNRRYASLVVLFKALGHPDNPAAHEHVSAHLKAMRRERRHGTGRGQAAALRWKDIERIIEALDPDASIRDARARLALALAYDGMLRREELAALRVEDLQSAEGEAAELGEDHAGIRVSRSKTNQDGDPELLHCAQLTARWARAWIERIGLGPKDHLICRLDDAGNPSGRHDTPIPHGQIASIFKRAAEQAGFSEAVVAKISGHSPRIGATQDLVAEGMPLVDIMFVGRWKSPQMVFRYAKALGTRYHATAVMSGRQGRGPTIEPSAAPRVGLVGPAGAGATLQPPEQGGDGDSHERGRAPALKYQQQDGTSGAMTTDRINANLDVLGAARRLRPDISVEEIQILLHLARTGRQVTLAHLVQQLDLVPSQASKAVVRLQGGKEASDKERLVASRPQESDPSTKLIQLSDAGREFTGKILGG